MSVGQDLIAEAKQLLERAEKELNLPAAAVQFRKLAAHIDYLAREVASHVVEAVESVEDVIEGKPPVSPAAADVGDEDESSGPAEAEVRPPKRRGRPPKSKTEESD